jgi:hypothetical protein
MFGRIVSPLNSELKVLGEFGGGLLSSRDFSNRSFGSNGGLSGDSNVSSNNGLLSNGRSGLLLNFGGSI